MRSRSSGCPTRIICSRKSWSALRFDSSRSSSSRCAAEVLRLVHDQHGALALRVHLDQEMHEVVVQLDVFLAPHLEPEGEAHPLQQPPRLAAGVAHEPHHQRLVEALEQAADQRGLARADLAGDEQERGVVQQAVLHQEQRPHVVLGEVQEPRVRPQRERLLAEAVELLVHRQYAYSALRSRREPLSTVPRIGVSRSSSRQRSRSSRRVRPSPTTISAASTCGRNESASSVASTGGRS